MGLVSACEPYKQSKLRVLFPPLHLDAVVLVLAPVIYINVSPFHLFPVMLNLTHP